VNGEELKTLTKSASRRPLWTPDGDGVEVSIGRAGIERLIPHRDPFLLIDGITDVGLGSRGIRGHRRVDPGDPVFRGHFPGRPIYPGVLQLESIGQLGLCLLELMAAGSTDAGTVVAPRDARAVKVHAAQFLDAVRPDDDLTLVCRVLELDEFTATCAGQVVRGQTICSFGVMEVYFADT
jgi:3-hydroxyacyl-[acyl-carrier-protein] dehydratase